MAHEAAVEPGSATLSAHSAPIEHILARAATRAILAPSVHNTQPWKLRLTGDALEIYVDTTRRLKVLDPRGRQMMISCGCAVLNARVAIAAWGRVPVVERFPDPDQPQLAARITTGEQRSWSALAVLDEAIDHRHTNRRAFLADPPTRSTVERLVAAARAEDTTVLAIEDPDARRVTAQLSQLADQVEQADPRYRREMQAWTTDDPRRTDGVQASSVPYIDEAHRNSGDPLPIRQFDTRGMGWLPQSSQSDDSQALLLFTAPADDRATWLRTGEALERVWLEATERGYWASPLTQVIEVKLTHGELRAALNLTEYPQVLLRVGKAPAVGASRRRPLSEVLIATGEETEPTGSGEADV